MSKFRFDRLAARIRAGVPEVLDKMANNAVNHFKVDNFNAEGFIDESVERWQPRKSKRDNAGRRLMVKTGRLRESIKVLSRYGNSRKIGTLVPYAPYHNYGIPGRLPKRQMIGNSRVLERKNFLVLQNYLKRFK
jgi:phage gpG-like protein